MLTPDYYESCADDIIDLYAQLDEAIIADITRRIIKTGRITESAKWQIKQAQEMGLLYDDIIAEIGRRTDAAESHVRALFEDAGVKTVEFDNQIYRKAGLVPVDIRQSPAMLQVLNAGFKKTLGNMKNLTLTTANTSQNAFYNACNAAYMKVTSGAFSYQEAIKEAIKQTAQQGSTVLYPSGHIDKVDVAVRRAVLTGVGQTCRTVCETNAIEMGCDLMELSAHSGARPSHAVWQGQLVSLSGRKGYLSKDDIGYETVEGFGGVNCLHDWFPYFEGISTRNYTEEALKQMNAKSFEYNGKQYSEYEISQIQRKLEREIRAVKREKAAYQVAVEESDGELRGIMQEALKYSNSLVREKQAKMRDFINQTGEQRQYFREQNYGKVAYNGLTATNNGVIINTVTEMQRKKDNSRKDFKIIDETKFANLTIQAIKNGAIILRGTEEVEKHLDSLGANASTIGDIILFRKEVCLSEVLEETYHFMQNKAHLNDDEPEPLRTYLNEIDAKQYLLDNINKFKIPRNETELTKKQLKYYKEALKEYMEKSDLYE